ncbi:MAG: hypothetical protein ACRC36_15845 [Lacrimispora sphenoides]
MIKEKGENELIDDELYLRHVEANNCLSDYYKKAAKCDTAYHEGFPRGKSKSVIEDYNERYLKQLEILKEEYDRIDQELNQIELEIKKVIPDFITRSTMAMHGEGMRFS